MRIAQDVSRKDIWLDVTKKPLIAFKVEEGAANRKLGKSRTCKLYMQLEEDNFPVYSLTKEGFELGSPKDWLIFKKQVKQVLKGQNMGNMDNICTLVQDLLKGDALTVFNNEQATFEEQMSDNLDHCLNSVIVQVFPNKAYKLQKWYI
eukprot:2663912-Ditylum_brightwellii.AAC.1